MQARERLKHCLTARGSNPRPHSHAGTNAQLINGCSAIATSSTQVLRSISVSSCLLTPLTMVDIAAAVKRYVPGAEALVPSSSSTSSSSTSKNKSKKKADKKIGPPTPAGGKAENVAATTANAGTTTTTTDDKPVALLSQAPSADDLPRELVADPREVEKELAKDQDREQQQQQLERKKGPAEEMVFKRIKLLNKKIVSALQAASGRVYRKDLTSEALYRPLATLRGLPSQG